ncbi:type 2 lanthipeptide synthetase LanM family protein [Archangium lipolyticum]|uniref:type 2 lanthipeptide synthetase LanM family protein n=1 Tax=Archangium lipolyticum TaxID=2970465 RepID=UPI00214A3676|nr:type 2 lanthipeptide synthetase LanM family protein [Archangium lipolyticum]
MTDSAFASAAWFRAMTLSERRERLERVPDAGDGGVQQEAARLLEKWREKEPFKSGAVPFEKRLEAEGLTEAELRYLLTESPPVLQRRFEGHVPWLSVFREAFSQPVSSEPFPLPPNLQSQPVVGFLEAVRPLIERGRARVRAHVKELARTHASLLFSPDTVEPMLFAALPRRLLERINRTMVLEMNIARLQGRLKGESGPERFQSFVESLRQPEVVLSLFQEYSVLARLCTQTVEQWSDASIEFLTRLAGDGPSLRELLPPGEPGLLTELSGDGGDQHHDGRMVQTLTFSSGARLVYKPRPLAVDAHFQDLLAWLNAREELPAFRLLRLLPREGYGWSEFVDARPCESEEGVRRFYFRLGAQLALFQQLGGMDMHYENLIAEGEHPVVVDLETLFHPQVSDRMNFRTDEERRFTQIIDYSLSRIALLPLVAWSRADHEGVDVGGMGSPEGQLTPREVPYWEEQGHDTMRQARKRITMKGARNLPTLRGEPVKLHRYQDDLCDGYARMCRLLMRERDAFLAPGGPVRRFVGDEIRVLLRSTQIYYTLLQESYHPDLLRDGLERDRYFDGLWMGMKRRPFLTGVASAERAALHRGDIPRYTTRPESKDLWSGPGERFPDFLWCTGLESTENRLRELDEATVERDVWWIRSSLLSSMSDVPLELEQAPPRRSETPVARGRLVAAARAIGDRILTLAVARDGTLSWLGAHQGSRNRWPFSPLTLDLYGGMPGITLFLAQLGQVSGEERFTQAARQVSSTLRRLTSWALGRMHVIGGFEGWGGILYTLTQLGQLWNEPALFSEAEAVVETLPSIIEKDRNLDVIGGAAGCIGGLLALRHATGSAPALAAAVRCGEHLLATRQPQEGGGAGWMTTVPSARPLSGFSHGASGMAWALLELASASGEARFREAAREALTYERTLFSPEQENWRDVRNSPDLAPAASGQSTCAWCYGAPGIGLARARALKHLDEPGLREDLRAAVAGTLRHGFGYNDSLCHGDLGDLEVLVQARALGEAPDGLDALISGTLEAVLSRAEQRAWRCAVPFGIETPGLMIGLAGIGWGLLRFAEPERVPNILLLEPLGARDGMIR